MKKAKTKAKAKPEPTSLKKRSYLSQADVPSMSIEDALRIPVAIQENYAGASSTPLKVAKALDIEPGGSKLRMLSGAAVAYRLIAGGAQAAEISLTDLARRIVKPTVEGDDLVAKREAFLGPRIVGEFLRKYNNAQLPRTDIAHNVLEEMGVPSDKAQLTLSLIITGAQSLGLTQDIKGKTYVDLTGVAPPIAEETAGEEIDDMSSSAHAEEAGNSSLSAPPSTTVIKKKGDEKTLVFVSHGKNRQILQQIKEILVFGKFDPVISIEKESTAIPVPDKVFADMRRCSAGVIHVAREDEFLDEKGNRVSRINENVLIEIGAAIALYGKSFVLLVERGMPLPSNLQGLYRCEYEGDKLDYDATIKLLKTFNEFNL